LSQIAHLPNYDRELSVKLLSIFTDPFWYDSDGGFRLRPHTLFEMATPSLNFMRLWTRTLVGFPDVHGAWVSQQLQESIKSISEIVTMCHDELLGRQVWDTYTILLASPHVAPMLKVQGGGGTGIFHMPSEFFFQQLVEPPPPLLPNAVCFSHVLCSL
jgi:hypothetical protein